MVFSYAKSGVNIDAGNALVDRIKPIAKATHRPGVLSGLGGFGALFELPMDRYQQPVLVSGTDGVGTKLKLAIHANQHHTIGIDLVAMCVNDLIVCGAEPLYFLDYYATGQLDVDQATAIISGIGKGCELAGCALIGGETAEMPGMYHNKDYDLAGFAVGIVEKNKIIDGSQVKTGDVIIGLASSGPHSNGYSLIRKIIDDKKLDLDSDIEGQPLIDALLAPTQIYVKSILALQKVINIHAMAHITGGGFTENIPRVLPHHTEAQINQKSWPMPAIFTWLQDQAQCDWFEMYRTFNCGIGMVIIIDKNDADAALACLTEQGETATIIGEIKRSNDLSPTVTIS